MVTDVWGKKIEALTFDALETSSCLKLSKSLMTAYSGRGPAIQHGFSLPLPRITLLQVFKNI